MTHLIAQLPDNEFIRIHKSYVVARSHIVSFNSRQASVEGVILPVGRTYTDALRRLKNFRSESCLGLARGSR